MTSREPFPVLCDRCRAEGIAGEAQFAELAGLGDLLDFEPVPRRIARADGWTPEIQRAFVAALAVTGSERQAAAVVGRAQFGATQLRKAEGNESFLAACDKAMELFHEKERVRCSDGLLAAARGEAARRGPGRPRVGWSNAATRQPSPQPPEPTEAEQQSADDVMWELLQAFVRKYLNKLEQERRARLAGRIAEADFYVRQITCLEVSLDMVSGDGMAIMRDYRCRGYDLLHIAETPFSKLLDEARRQHWEACGDPPRPEHPPRHLLVEKEGFAVEPVYEHERDPGGTWREQQRREDERAALDAEAQIAWEAQAREAAAAWRQRLEADEARDGPPAPIAEGESR